MNFSHDFQQDLATILAELGSCRPFAFNRFADGELAILEERDIPTADVWSAVNVSDKFRERLKAALTYRDKDYYVGIGCPCCNKDEWLRLMSLAGREPDDPQVTFSNVFVNENYEAARAAMLKAFPIFTPRCNLVNGDDSAVDEIVSSMSRTQDTVPMLLAAGPAGKIIIHEVWKRGLRRTIVDVGSLFDLDMTGCASRSYHDPNHPNRQKICQWSPKTIDNTLPSSI